jgi:hypothetical protein
MKERAPAKVGSLAAEVREAAVKAWSIDLLAKRMSFEFVFLFEPCKLGRRDRAYLGIIWECSSSTKR